MLESYKVGATLELRDEVSARLRGLYEKVEQFDKLLKGVQKQFSAFGETKLAGVSGSITAISDKIRSIGTAADASANKIRSSFQSIDGSVVQSGRALTGYLNNLDRIGLIADTEASAAAKAFGRIDGAVAGSERAIGGLDARIGAIGSTSGASTAAAIGHLGQLNSALNSSTQAAQGLRQAMRLPGFGGGGGGGSHPRPGQGSGHGGSGGHAGNTYGRHGAVLDAGIFGMIGYESVKESVEASVHRGMELTHVQEQMRQAGIGDDDIARATAGAWKEARSYGLPVDKVLGDIKELVLPFGSVGHAIEFIEPLEKMRVVLNAITEGRGNESSEAVYKMARAGELKGLNNAEDYLRYFDGMTKAISASGGKVTPNSFAQVTQYGKLASQGWSEDFYTKSLPTLMQTMNASTAGQSLMSLFNTLESGAVSKRSLAQMEDLGLVGDYSKIHYDKQGNPVGYEPGAIKGSALLAQNPLEWARQFLTPLLEQKYGDLGTDANRENAITHLGGLFGNRNSAAAIAELALRVKSFDRDKGLIEQAHGIGGADALLKNDPTTAMNNFSAAWSNLLTALGGPAVKPATDAINSISGSLNRLGEFTQAHPDAAKSIEGVMAGLAVGLGSLAVVGLAAFAPGGIAVVALVSLAGALTGFAAVNWDKIQAISQSMGLSMENFHKNITDIAGAFDRINAVLTKFFTGLVNAVRSIPGLERLIPGGPGEEFGPNLPHQFFEMPPDAYDRWLKKKSDLYKPTSFGEAANDNSLVEALAMGVFKGLTMYASGGGSAGGFGGGGSGIVNASWGGGDFHPGTSPAMTPLLRGANRGGFNPYVGGTGGGTFVPPVGDHLTAGMRQNNMGNIGYFGQHMAGLLGPSNAHDVDHSIAKFATQEDGIRAAAALALSKFHKGRHTTWDLIAARGGWTPGALGPGASVNIARAMGVGNHDQINLDDPEQMVRFLHGLAVQEHGAAGQFYTSDRIRAALGHRSVAGKPVPTVSGPPRKVTPGAPATEANNQPIVIEHHSHTHLDGQKVAHVVTRRQVADARFRRSVGATDHYGRRAHPGSEVMDA